MRGRIPRQCACPYRRTGDALAPGEETRDLEHRSGQERATASEAWLALLVLALLVLALCMLTAVVVAALRGF